MEILKQISPDTTSLLGEDATFFVTVTNHGPAPATGIVVKDLLPAGLTLVSAHVSQGSYVPQTGLWIVGTLEDEAFATLTLIATLDRGRFDHESGPGPAIRTSPTPCPATTSPRPS